MLIHPMSALEVVAVELGRFVRRVRTTALIVLVGIAVLFLA